MSDQQRTGSTCHYANLATFALPVAIFVASAPALAYEGAEQFSLVNQPAIFFDGGSGALTGEYNGISYEIIHGYAVAQGDMVLGKVLPNGKLDVPVQTRALGQSSLFDRWPDGIIPYQFTDDISESQREKALQAIAHWNSKTRIQIIPRTVSNAVNYENYISFELSGGCASYVGMKGGEQSVWLADNCTVGSIIHEIGHAIGLFHEHTRLDRDNYVTVNLQNVFTNKEINFDKIDIGANAYSDYDYGSIMHYGEYFFSRNGEKTISVPDNVSIGQRDALSDKDIAGINWMYATDLKLSVSTENTDDGTQVELVVANIGNLGAFAVAITADWGDDADWLSFSAGAGWDCEKMASIVSCTRPSLRELSDSSFSILAAPNELDVSSLKIRVESRTLDTDLTNNVFNDTITSQNTNSEPDDPVLVTDITPTNPAKDNTPDSTNETDSTANNGTDTTLPELEAAQAGEGGGAAFYLFTLLLSVFIKRKSSY